MLRKTYLFALCVLVTAIATTAQSTLDPTQLPIQTNPAFTVDRLTGININRDAPLDKLDCAGFVREYHSWILDQGDGMTPHNLLNGPPSPEYPNQEFRWNPPYQAQFPIQFDDFYQTISGQGIEICADMIETTSLMGNTGDLNQNGNWDLLGRLERKPLQWNLFNDSQNPGLAPGLSTTDPNSYREHADWLHNFAARYGNSAYPTPLTKYPDETQVTGLGLVDYMECFNEQNKWWVPEPGENPFLYQFSGAEYAAMASMDFDGNGGQFMNELCADDDGCSPGEIMPYEVGINIADPTMGFAMGGTWNITLEDIDNDGYPDHLGWLEEMASAMAEDRCPGGVCPDGVEPFVFDVVNFHEYCYLGGDGEYGSQNMGNSIWVAPEEFREYGLRGELVSAQHLIATHPLMSNVQELWLSEFGYDDLQGTVPDFPAEFATIDPTFHQTIADWTVRSVLEISASGFDRGVVYNIRDAFPEGGTWAQNTGLLERDNSPKTAWWYLTSLRKILDGKYYDGQEPNGECNGFEGYPYAEFGIGNCPDDICTRIYRYTNGGDICEDPGNVVYAYWSPTSCGAAYTELHELSDCNSVASGIRLVNGSVAGASIELDVTSVPGFAIVPVSETPIFVVEEPREAPECIDEAVVEAQATCNSLTLEWEVAPDQQYDSYNLFFAPNDNGTPGDLQFAATINGSATSFTFAGLMQNQSYFAYIIPQNCNGVPVDDDGQPILCAYGPFPDDETDSNDDNSCYLTIQPDWLTHNHSGCMSGSTDITGSLFDEQNIDFCNGAEPTSPWICFQNQHDELITTVDLQSLHNIYSFDVFDGTDVGMLTIQWSNDGINFTTFLTHTLSLTWPTGWTTLSGFDLPEQGIRYLRFITEGNGQPGNIGEILICGDEVNLAPPYSLSGGANCDGRVESLWHYDVDLFQMMEIEFVVQAEVLADPTSIPDSPSSSAITFNQDYGPGDIVNAGLRFSGPSFDGDTGFECGEDIVLFVKAVDSATGQESPWQVKVISVIDCEFCQDNLCGCEETELSIYESNPEGELIKPASEPTGPAALFDEEVGEPFCDFPEAPQNGWQLTTPYQTEYAVLDLGYEAHLKDLTLYAGEGRGALHIAPGRPGNFRDYFIHVSRQDYHHPEWLSFNDLNVRTRYLLLRLEGEKPNFGELRVCTNKLAEPVRDPNLYVSGVSCESLQVTVGNLGNEEYTAVQLYYSAQGGYTGIGHPHQSNEDARSAVAYLGANGSAELRLPYLRPDTEYHFAYRLLTASGYRSAYIYPGQTGRTANCKEEEFFSDSGVLLDEECRLTGLQWSYDLSEHPGHFELIEANVFSEDPTLVAQTNTEIGKNETGQYRFELSSTPKGRYPYVYLRYVSYRGTSSPWYVWDTSIAPCGETRGRTGGYFGTALSGAVVVAEGFSIHPNPTDDLLYLTADSRRFTQYAIIDALGSTLLSGPVDPTVRTMKLPTADLTPGIYFLQLRGRKTRWQSLRFVVVK